MEANKTEKTTWECPECKCPNSLFLFEGKELPDTLEWAEERRNKLRWKLKCNIALKNRILFWILLLPACVLEAIGLTLLIGMFLYNLTTGTSAGIFAAGVIIFVWVITYSYLDDYFETDPYYIYPK